MHWRTICCWLALVATASAQPKGYEKEVAVSAAGRIDCVFPLANQSPAQLPGEWTPDYAASEQTYECYVPPRVKPKTPAGLILFISPGDRGTGFENFRKVCDESGMIYASPHAAGNECETRRRVRIVVDVLDDLRHKHEIDPARTWIGGFSGGARIACSIAFALPEYFGGVIPVCAAGDLRMESWLRHRVVDRLAVAHLTGETDFNRAEVERFRSPALADFGVRSRVWVIPRLGHAIPRADEMGPVAKWLDESLAERRKFGKTFPAGRADKVLSREEHAAALFREATGRMKSPDQFYAGLMQMKGVLDRWPDLPEAAKAREILLKQEEKPEHNWEEQDIAEQRRFVAARARGLSAYALGDLPQQYRAQRGEMARAALELWKALQEDAQDAKLTAEADKVVPQLEAILK